MKKTYEVAFLFEGTEEDVISMRKMLAQVVADEFELEAVFGVAVAECDEQ